MSSPLNEHLPAPAGNWIIYDGDCPFCRNYMRLVRLKQAIGPVRLIDARAGGPEADFVRSRGLDLDEGMAMFYEGTLYHGGDCLHLMAMLSSRSGFFNRATAWIFATGPRSRALYPLLRFCRNLALRVLGKRKISGEPF
jgi:predicted DCC family thiol-disulfide oxidoreductase YuxK